MNIGPILQEAADTLPIWRDIAITALAFIVIGALWLYATVVGVE